MFHSKEQKEEITQEKKTSALWDEREEDLRAHI